MDSLEKKIKEANEKLKQQSLDRIEKEEQKRKAEEQARIEAAERARIEAEERAKREAEEKARREAEEQEKARREAEQKERERKRKIDKILHPFKYAKLKKMSKKAIKIIEEKKEIRAEEARKIEEEKRKIEEEKRKIEEEKRRIEKEKEEEERRILEEKKRAEEEQRKIEAANAEIEKVKKMHGSYKVGTIHRKKTPEDEYGGYKETVVIYTEYGPLIRKSELSSKDYGTITYKGYVKLRNRNGIDEIVYCHSTKHMYDVRVGYDEWKDEKSYSGFKKGIEQDVEFLYDTISTYGKVESYFDEKEKEYTRASKRDK